MSALELIEPPETAARQPSPQRAMTTMATPADLLRLAVENGADLDRLERLMALQERWEAGEARKAFVQAMTEFKAQPLEIFKRKKVGYATKEGDFVGYKHAELSDVASVVVPALAQHGLSHRWDVKQENNRIVVTCIVTHRAGHSESVTLDAAPDNSGKKNAIQQVASAITYMQRYTLLAITGLATQDQKDDDGRGAGNDADDTKPEDEDRLRAFQAAALDGYAALKKHYETNTPPDEFWAQHKKALIDAARQVDADRRGAQ